MTRRILLVGAVGAAMLVGPATAPAGTIGLDLTTGPSGGDQFVVYQAKRGEKNRVSVRRGAGLRLTVTDRAARVTVARASRRWCRVLGRHRARCNPNLARFTLRLGDRDDRATLSPLCTPAERREADAPPTQPRTPAGIRSRLIDDEEGGDDSPQPIFGSSTIVMGGDGDDKLTGSCSSETFLPGPGIDTVKGAGEDDTVFATPDGVRDVFDGQAGTNSLSFDPFDAPSTPIEIDLEAGTAGAGTDLDTVRSFSLAEGGPGNDRVLGTPAAEGLLGAGGSDFIDGRGGPDYIACFGGTDTIVSHPGDLVEPNCTAPPR